jgi:hypothetical protein
MAVHRRHRARPSTVEVRVSGDWSLQPHVRRLRSWGLHGRHGTMKPVGRGAVGVEVREFYGVCH